MWSLECLYLEFTTWLLTGESGNEFSEVRAETSITGVTNDKFFIVMKDNVSGLTIKVRGSVIS